MKVSILIPFYNVSSFIERALLSALNQSYDNIECILVDDGSTDDSYLKVLSIIGAHPRGNVVHLFQHEKNKGIATTRNTCISKATGEYIFFLDSDDELPLDAMEELMSVAETKNVDIVIGDFEIINGSRLKFPSIHLLSPDHIYDSKEAFNAFLQLKVTDMPCMKLIRREILLISGISFHPGIVHEDTLWIFSLMMSVRSMAVSDSICYLYYFRSGSITQEKSERNFVSLLIVMRKIIQISLGSNLFDKFALLVPYLNNLRYYMLKEMIRIGLEKSNVRDKFREINKIFSVISKKKNNVFNFAFFLRSLFFKLPFNLSFHLVKMILLIKNKPI